jgi:DNA-binding NtrC family response regulator
MAYSWPGNIRELRNVLERAAIMAGEGAILPKHLAMDPMAIPAEHEPEREPQRKEAIATERVETERPEVTASAEASDSIPVPPGATMEEIEEAYIDLILKRTNNNKTKAAEILGISVRTLHNRLGQLSNRKAKTAAGD